MYSCSRPMMIMVMISHSLAAAIDESATVGCLEYEFDSAHNLPPFIRFAQH